MADVDAQAVAARVRAARRRLGLSQQALAGQAGVSQASVSRIEGGTKPVTLAEADRLAQALQLPLDTMLFGSRVRERVLVSLRVADSDADASEAVSPAVDLLELDERLDAVVTDHKQQLKPRPGLGLAAERIEPGDGEKLAAQLRTGLGLGLAPVADAAALVEDLTGVDVASSVLSGVSGMYLEDPSRNTKIIMVNSAEPAERQRFTVMHELGHVLFGDGVRIESSSELDDPTETRAHEFARNLLIPLDAMRVWAQRHGDSEGRSEETLALLAQHFGVSHTVVAIQARRLNWQLPTQVTSTRELAAKYGWLHDYEARQAASNRPRPPQRLVKRVVAGYLTGRVGAAVVAHLTSKTVEAVEADLPARGSARPAGRRRVTADQLLAAAAR